MSLSLKAFLVAPSDLQAVLGNGRMHLEPQPFLSSDSGVLVATSTPERDQAVSGIPNGDVPDHHSPSNYVHALELVCQHFGQEMESELFRDYHSGWMEEVGIADALLYQEPLPIPIPESETLPAIGYVSPERGAEFLTELSKIDLAGDFCGSCETPGSPAGVAPEAIEGRYVLVDWLEEAVKRDMALVTFEY